MGTFFLPHSPIVTHHHVVPFLLVYILPFRPYFVMVVDMKGPDAPVVKRLSRLTREIGLTHYTYRSDREPAIRSILRDAALDAAFTLDAAACPPRLPAH